MNEFANRLKSLRERRGASYEDVGDFVGCNKSLIWRYETCRSEPGLTIFIKLADYFNVSLDWLAGNGEFEKIQYAGKAKYYNAINKCIEKEITPERLEQIVDIIGK